MQRLLINAGFACANASGWKGSANAASEHFELVEIVCVSVVFLAAAQH